MPSGPVRSALQRKLQGANRATLAVLIGTISHPALLFEWGGNGAVNTPPVRPCKRRTRSCHVEQERDRTHSYWTRQGQMGKPVRKT